MTRVLVTGASGFVGQQVIAALSAEKCSITAVTRHASADSFPNGVVRRQGDLLSSSFIASLFEDETFDIAVHLAWETRHGYFWTAPENQSWVRASLELLEGFVKAGGRRFISAGTCAEYTPVSPGPCRPDFTPTNPELAYSASKNTFHRRASSYAEENGLEFMSARLFSLIGQDDAPTRLIPAAIMSFARGEQFPCSSGRQIRDFMDVRDCGSAFAQLVFSSLSGPVNICSGKPISVRDLIVTIAEMMGEPDLPQFGMLPDRQGEPLELWGESFWKTHHIAAPAQHTLEQALRWTIEFWKNDVAAK